MWLAIYGILFALRANQVAGQQGCYCVNAPVAEVRTTDQDCGDATVYKEHTYGACWEATGSRSTCIVGGTEVEVMEVDYGNDRLYWFEAANMMEAPANCSKYTGDCANMEFVTREEWEAREPRTTTNVSTPFSMTFVHHTDGPSCFTLEECSETVRGIQDFHMDGNGWDDIGYNFLVGEDGRVYEGRGWTYRGAHAREHNDYSHGIAIMGDFMESLPLQQAFNALNNIIACGVDQGHISPGHELKGHRDGVCTLCPGDQLYANIQTWGTYSFREIPEYC